MYLAASMSATFSGKIFSIYGKNNIYTLFITFLGDQCSVPVNGEMLQQFQCILPVLVSNY